MKSPFRRKNFDPRLVGCYAAAALVFALAEPTPSGWALGGLAVGLGLALRAWAAGHLVKTDRLTVSGPYAHLRHPLYAGTLLVGAGFAVLAGPVAGALLAGCFLPLFFLHYLPRKERAESARLERRHGEVHARYRAEVPALVPRLSAWRPPPELLEGARGWSGRRFRENSEPGTVVGVAAAALLLALRPLLAP